jgi:FkbH-like protein
MRLTDAITIANREVQAGKQARVLSLVCGFTPLHLETYLRAYGRVRFPDEGIDVVTGYYGDLLGNLERACEGPGGEAAVIVEWADLDPRLGLRNAGGWGPSVWKSILAESNQKVERLVQSLRRLAQRKTVALCAPTLPLPPLGHTVGVETTVFELQLHQQGTSLLCAAAETPGVRIISRQCLDELSPPSMRLDVGLDLMAGFPYRRAHADVMAKMLIEVLYAASPKKGLITDLDETLWKGILGDVGVDGISWELADHSQIHALYQQFLAALAERGVLIAVASKNDSSLVEQVFLRKDVLLQKSSVFPFEVHWGAKSDSVGRILEAWNIGADSVVFIDDTPMELAEVQARYPQMECIEFPRKDPEAFWNLLKRLRDLFGKPVLLEEDRIRLTSLRSAKEVRRESVTQTPAEFLVQIAATVTIDFRKNPQDPRALELINKTNQFNLNGRRYTEAEWKSYLADASTFMLTISYEDKFGPLGKIGVLTGRLTGETLLVENWVMSCRAFSRRIEHHTLDRLLAHFGVQEASFAYRPTERNSPLRQFFVEFVQIDDREGDLRLTRERFAAACLLLPHEVRELGNG